MSGRTCRAENSQASRIVRPEFGPGQRAWPAAGWLFPEGRSPGSGVKRSEDAAVAGHLGVTRPRCLAKTGGAGPRGVHVRGRVHTLPMLSVTYSRFKKKIDAVPRPDVPHRGSDVIRTKQRRLRPPPPAPPSLGDSDSVSAASLTHFTARRCDGKGAYPPRMPARPCVSCRAGRPPWPHVHLFLLPGGSAGVVGGQAASA